MTPPNSLGLTRKRLLPARLWRKGRMLVHLFYGLVVTWVVFPRLNAAQKRARVQVWSGQLVAIAGVKIVVKGDVPPMPFVLVANHISWCDIFALNSVHPVNFVAKAELSRWPVAGRLVTNVGTLYIDRSRRTDTGRVVEKLAAHIRAGEPLAFFPEGRVGNGDGVLPFKASLLQPAIDANAPALPVAISYSPLPAFEYVKRDFLQSVWAVLSAAEAQVTLTLLPLEKAANRRDLSARLETVIRAELQRAVAENAPEKAGPSLNTGR